MPKTTKKITAIPATLTRFTATPITEQKKRRVAGYARVSTDHDDQFTSYEAQISLASFSLKFLACVSRWLQGHGLTLRISA